EPGQFASGAADEQDAEDGAITTRQWNRRHRFRAVRRSNLVANLVAGLSHAHEQRLEGTAVGDDTRRVDELPMDDLGLDVAIQHHPHAWRQNEGLRATLVEEGSRD